MTMRLLLIGFAVTWSAACQSSAPDADVSDDTATAQANSVPATRDSTTRDGLPLRTIMQQLGSDMSGFTQVMLLEDYDRMAAYADDIVNHPHMSPAEIRRIKSELGPEMEGFVKADEAVHQGALRLQEAAEARDMDLILERLHELQVGCMSCHTRFRQQLRTDQPAQ